MTFKANPFRIALNQMSCKVYLVDELGFEIKTTEAPQIPPWHKALEGSVSTSVDMPLALVGIICTYVGPPPSHVRTFGGGVVWAMSKRQRDELGL